MNRDDLWEQVNFHGRRGGHFLSRFVGLSPDQRQARELAAAAASLPAPDGKRVLFITPRDWFSHLHWEAMLGHALRLRGADVRFLTCGGELELCDRTTTYEAPPMPCSSCRRNVTNTIDAHGFDLTTMTNGFAAADASWPELDDMTLDELVEIVDGDLPLGRLVEIPVKWFLLNTTLEDDPLGVLTYRQFLRSARQVVASVRRHLEETQPDVLVLLNGLFFFESLAWAVARQLGIETVIYERGPIHGTLLFARETPAGWAFVDEAWPAWRDVELTDGERAELRDYLGARELGLRATEQYWDDVHFDDVARDPDRTLTTLFANITWDSAVINRDIAFDSIYDWIFSTIDYFIEHPGHDLLVRLHPAEIKLRNKPTREPIGAAIAKRYPTLPPNITVVPPDDSRSSYPLMVDSDLVTVLTSTAGLETALRGTPVIVTGKTAYRGKGFTLDADSREHYRELLSTVLADPTAFAPNVELAERYAHLFFFRAPFDNPGVEEHVRGIARLTRDLDGLAPGVDPSLDRLCDAILEGTSLEAPGPVAPR